MARMLAALLFFLFSACAYPAIYKCRDSNGQMVYSDKATACNKAQPHNDPIPGKLTPPISNPEINKTTKYDNQENSTKETTGRLNDEAEEVVEVAPEDSAQKSRIPTTNIKEVQKKILAYVLLMIGFIISFVYGVILLIKAFQESFWWGLGYLFVPGVPIIFYIVHWETAKGPFLKSLWAIPFLVLGFFLADFAFTGGGTKGFQASPNAPMVEAQESSYQCQGKTRCTQMTSCQEAEYYLKNCPDVEIDGDNDGIPCERQWCSN